MKKVIKLPGIVVLALVFAFAFMGCTGPAGPQGEPGANGIDGNPGTDGKDGIDGKDGADGVDGNHGTNGNNGSHGTTPHIGANGNWFIGNVDTGTKAATANTYTVMFDKNNGSDPIPQAVLHNGWLIQPKDPVKLPTECYTFENWYADGEDEAFDFHSPITAPIALYARYTETHDWGEWVVTTPATALADGEETRTCNHDATHKETRPLVFVSLIDMVRIEAGTFTMGGQGYTEHSVTLTQGFYMGAYLVTQGQYETVIGTNPSYFTTADGDDPDNRPVEQVSWYNALVFCNKLSMMEGLTPAYRIDGKTDPDEWGTVPTGNDATWNAVEIVDGSTGYRLPTEAQWEYACRAGTTTAFNWDTDTINDTQANYYASYVDSYNTVAGTFLGRTTEVGSYAANAWGLFDMHGNVWEWCWDWYEGYSVGAQVDPAGASSGSSRELRSGSWNSSAAILRSAYRSRVNPISRNSNLGFRLARP